MQLTLFLHLRATKAILVNEWSNTNWTKWTKWTEWNEFCEMSEQESDVARWGRNKVSCMAAFTNYLGLLFPFYCLWFKSVGFRLWRIFFLFFDLSLLFLFFCLWFDSVEFRLWWFFYFFDFCLLFTFYCLWFQSVGCSLWWIFFCFLIWDFFFHFIAIGLSPSGLGYDRFFLFFDLGLLFPFYCL